MSAFMGLPSRQPPPPPHASQAEGGRLPRHAAATATHCLGRHTQSLLLSEVWVPRWNTTHQSLTRQREEFLSLREERGASFFTRPTTPLIFT